MIGRLVGWLRSLFRREPEPGPAYNRIWSGAQARRWDREDEPCRIVGKGKVPGIAVVAFPDGQHFLVERGELHRREVAA